MKIGDAPGAFSGVKIERNRTRGSSKTGSSKSAGATFAGTSALSESVSIAGVPDVELTPKVREALGALMEEVQSLRDELTRTRERLGDLEKLADRDPLLDIYNRRAFVRELDRTLAMIERYGMRASLVFVDLNDLKKINDTKGHGAGDAALGHIADMIAANVRQTDVLGRLGGDEFGLLLTQTDQATAELKAEQLARIISEQPVLWKGDPFTAQISCGVVEIAKGQTVDEAMERADNAMYEEKARKNGN